MPINPSEYPLADAEALHKFLSKNGLGANKSLGQHFLCSVPVASAIVEATGDARGILEIGPGPGVLTGPLSMRAEKMVALELDGRMLGLLAKSAPKVQIFAVDALKADLRSILQTLPKPRAIVSNLPYYITGPLIARIADVRQLISVAILMMQREVADRICAASHNSDRGAVSVALQEQFDISLVCQVLASAFVPPPKVQSTVLRFEPRAELLDEALFLAFVRKGFSQPRKTLVNNLLTGQVSKERTADALTSLKLDERIRPHALSAAEWKSLYQLLGVA